MKKMVVMSLLTLSMVAGSFSYVCAASLNHTSEIATYYQSRKLDRVPKEAVEELLGITLPDKQE